MARMMAQYVAPAWLAYPLLVVPVAASDRARRQRGYDHGLELACYLAEYLGRRAYSAFLPPKSIDQRQLSRKGRLQNMAQALMLRADFRPPSAVLLVDDVCTTGATLLCAAQALKDAGVASVFCITFARTY